MTCKQNTVVGSQDWKEQWMRHYTASNPINCTKPLINDQHEILIKIYPTWLSPKILDLTLISVSRGCKRWGVWYISSQILLLRDIDDHIINQHIIYDQKRRKRTIFIKSIKNHICHLSKRPETTVEKYLPLKYILDMIFDESNEINKKYEWLVVHLHATWSWVRVPLKSCIIKYHIISFLNCILSQYITEYIQNKAAYLLSPYVVHYKECFTFSLVEMAHEIKKMF